MRREEKAGNWTKDHHHIFQKAGRKITKARPEIKTKQEAWKLRKIGRDCCPARKGLKIGRDG